MSKLTCLFCFVFLCHSTVFSITKVGNSDDGSDLEGAERVEGGPIIQTRTNAVDKLQKLNISAIEGLGQLIPEVEKSNLYLAKADIVSSLPMDGSHASVTGLVYARTLAEPHASTRFFPVATTLSPEQLIALHIHEGLHRALPAHVRKDEKKVARITLAITAPGATFDSVNAAAQEAIPKVSSLSSSDEEFISGSNVGYTYKSFFQPKSTSSYGVGSMHLIHSHLYPFGNADTRLGLGLDLSYVNGPSAGVMGPLGISAHFRVLNYRGFVFHFWGTASLNTLSAEELKQSPFGRDVFILGLAIKKKTHGLYVENFSSISLGGTAQQQIGAVNYTYDYGAVIDVKIRAGMQLLNKLELGAFAELHLADYFKVNGGAFTLDSGRFRIFSVGPEINVNFDDWEIGIFSRFLVDSTKNASYDFLGYLMGPGVAEGNIGATIKLLF